MNTIATVKFDFDSLVQHGKACSRYLQRLLEAEPDYLPWLKENYQMPCTPEETSSWLTNTSATDEAVMSRALRDLRKRVMLKILMRDLGGLADLDEVVLNVTALAELAIQQALQVSTHALMEQHGQPIGEQSGRVQQLLVVGMGKLGGGELNVSSDVDLIFVYPEEGETNGARPISNHEFFTRLGRRIIGLISEHTAHGYVFRVDMRLRPYGDSGALVSSFAALEEYLITQGREWERYAWIKARVIAPRHSDDTQELMSLVQPFIFRKYLDYGAFESMRQLHAQIRQEVIRRERANNIKLGPGGIREIEFIAQVFQLIRGGREAELRVRTTLQVLRLLANKGQLEGETMQQLQAAYIFLRNLEHRLQYLDDQQTQDMPEDELNRKIIATAMGCQDYPELMQQLDFHRTHVSQHFEQIFIATQEQASSGVFWNEHLSAESLSQVLAQQGYSDAAELAEQILQLRNCNRYLQLQEIGRQRIDKAIPQLIHQCAKLEQRNLALSRLLKLVEQISRRSTYLAFMTEHPQALERLTRFAAASEWACNYLAQHPSLLDELLDAREIYRVPDWQQIDKELAMELGQNDGDLEQQMEVLRHFKHRQTFQLLALDLQGLLPLETLSDHLSDLADLILEHVLSLCWRTARKKHREQASFAIIAYGKLGGRELGYDSDLDLIFLFDDEHEDAAENYAKLAQRINTVLGSYTPAGRLYETDLRLRPNGASGLLVSSVQAFAEYQAGQAWVWEHQALTRARFCAGNREIGKRFEEIRTQVISQTRDIDSLRQEILKMREKMHAGHPNDSELFDIKHDHGGMVDIEFMVQFLVLAHAAKYQDMSFNSGNIALLSTAGKLGLINPEIGIEVSKIYRNLRRIQHSMRLNNQPHCRVPPETIDTSAVKSLWQTLLPGTT